MTSAFPSLYGMSLTMAVGAADITLSDLCLQSLECLSMRGADGKALCAWVAMIELKYVNVALSTVHTRAVGQIVEHE